VSLDKSDKAEKVILGVGGFLGMGEHLVAVPFEKIKWVNEPVPSTTASKSTASADKPAANVIATLVRLPTAPPKLRPGLCDDDPQCKRKLVPDHALYNTTKDQLTAMPQFKY
jgi:hypothetical protein